MNTKVRNKSFLKGFFKFLLYLLLAIVILVIIALIAIRTPYVKNKIAQEGIGLVNKQFGTQISAQNVEIDWKNNLILHEVKAKDDHEYDFIAIKRLEGDINIIELVKYLYSQDWAFTNLKFEKIILDESNLDIITYQNDEKDNFSQFLAKFSSDKEKSGDPFIFQSDVDFNKGTVKIRNLNKSNDPSFQAKDLNFKIRDFKTVGSDITAKMTDFNTEISKNEKKLQVINWTGDLKYTPTLTQIQNLFLETPNSKVDADALLTYDSVNDLSNFENLVNLNIEIRDNSYVSGHFLDFIGGKWDNNSIYNIHALAVGTVNDLLITQLYANSQNVKLRAKSVHLNQITSGDAFSIHLKGFHAIASEQSLREILPSDIASKIKNKFNQFGTLDYTGDLFLNSEKIKGNGELLSSLGYIKLDAELQNYSGATPLYQGFIQTQNVTLLPILQNNSIRNLTGQFQFEGQGFDEKTAKIHLDGILNEIAYNNFQLRNIDVDASYQQQIVEGKLISNDPNANLEAEGMVNFQHSTLLANLKGVISHLALGKFVPSQANTDVQGLFEIEAKASSLNDLTGKMDFQNIIYNSPEKVMAFEKIDINTYFEDKNRILNIDAPNNIHGVLKGRFNIEDIPVMFQNGISKMVVGLEPQKKLREKYLFLDLDIQDNVVDLFFPKFQLESGTNIIGTYDSETNDLILNLSAPKLSYDNIIADSIDVKINTDNPNQQFLAQVNSLYIDTYILKRVKTSGYLKDDTLRVENTFNINDINNQLVELNLFQTQNNDELIVGVDQSKFEVNDIDWQINPKSDYNTNLITYNKADKVIYVNRFSLVSDIAQINAKGYYKNAEDFEFEAEAKDVLLENIIPKNALGEFTLQGLINGKVSVKQNGHILSPIANVDVQNLHFNNYEMGDLVSTLKLDPEVNNQFDMKTELVMDDHSYFDFTGKIINSPDEPASFNGKARFDEFQMDILNELLSGVFDNIRGTCTGEVDLSGPFKNPIYNGYLVTKDMGLTIDFLQTDYEFKDGSEIGLVGDFKKGSMNFDNISFEDTQELTQGYLFGSIQNKEFKTWFLDLYFESAGNKGLMILNTDENDNELFYGKVYAKGDFNLYGSTAEKISVYSDAEILSDSKFTLNNATQYTIENNSIIRFKSANKTQEKSENPEELKVESGGLALNFILDIQKGAEIVILLDEFTNSTIEVKGEAKDFSFEMSESGEMAMNGVYLVDDGFYNFKIGPLSKKFRIDNKSWINFTGNPYNAALSIYAYNDVVVNNIGEYLNIQTSPTVDMDLGVNLEGSLNNMTLDFSIRAPKASSDIQSLLQSKFYNNLDEERLQFFSLLANKRFNTEQNALLSTSTLASNAYDLILNQFLNIFNIIDPNFQLSANYVPEDLATNSPSMVRATLNWRLSDRWKITSIQGIPINTSNATNNDIWTKPEVEVEYDLSQKNDQSIIFEAFTRPNTFGLENYALTSSTYQSYGAGIVLSWEFDKWSEFFDKFKKHKSEEKEKPLPKIDPADSAAIIERQINEFLSENDLVQMGSQRK